MKRSELAGEVSRRLGAEHIVICGMGATTFTWRALNSPTPTYYSADPMGLSPGLALGFAVSRPRNDIVLLVGDGDLVMNLSALLAWAQAAPENLRMVVFHNHRYETGGGQAIPAGDRLRLDEVAAAMGIGWTARTGADDAALSPGEAIDALLAARGPAMLVVDLEAETAEYADLGDISGAEDRTEFQRQIRSV
ncbi:thiamine pyrophosphate-dependent enzyme [Nocardia sp. CA-290969]|uniref:thiamine pyrophosphate-dependent enzyme n=1 Tax=Nocardia sp. CA-290969 TaxID=3239986 RepID=UPI003D9488F3